ncbi:E3 ubiquitin-protein ligase UPL5 [Trifolium repens]|nr:E3 ubiquitin-protein ligase UPL5 [Trifolium repens]
MNQQGPRHISDFYEENFSKLSMKQVFGTLYDLLDLYVIKLAWNFLITCLFGISTRFVSFVRELADSLLMNLESSIDSPSLACPLLTNIGDFTTFLVPVRTGIEQHQALRGCVPYQKLDRNGLVIEEIECLHLLYKIDTCLQKMEKRFFDKEMVHEENYFYPACSLYLSLLKELHKISKLMALQKSSGVF